MFRRLLRRLFLASIRLRRLIFRTRGLAHAALSRTPRSVRAWAVRPLTRRGVEHDPETVIYEKKKSGNFVPYSKVVRGIVIYSYHHHRPELFNISRYFENPSPSFRRTSHTRPPYIKNAMCIFLS